MRACVPSAVECAVAEQRLVLVLLGVSVCVTVCARVSQATEV